MRVAASLAGVPAQANVVTLFERAGDFEVVNQTPYSLTVTYFRGTVFQDSFSKMLYPIKPGGESVTILTGVGSISGASPINQITVNAYQPGEQHSSISYPVSLTGPGAGSSGISVFSIHRDTTTANTFSVGSSSPYKTFVLGYDISADSITTNTNIKITVSNLTGGVFQDVTHLYVQGPLGLFYPFRFPQPLPGVSIGTLITWTITGMVAGHAYEFNVYNYVQ